EEEARELIQRYILGRPESIESKLAQDRSLRIYTLSLIASEVVSSLKGLLDFFNFTFFGFQYKEVPFLENKIKNILNDLGNWRFIEKNDDKLSSTFLGRRISCLYLDPKTAHFFIQALKMTQDLGISDLTILQIIAYSDEMQPSLNLRHKDLEQLMDIVNSHKGEILMDVPLAWDDNYEDFLRSLKTALCFLEWIEETDEASLLERFQITPGELYNKLEIVDWLIYALIEIAKVLGLRKVIRYLKRLRIRLNYGIKEELIELVSLSQIGRVRARRLFEAGIKDISSLRKAPLETINRILGKKIALKVKEQLK
ncbi:MAG: helix-hairpin-helix domain-containing protein, partial [Candidatus Omnitrophica bacterium]|nr:helix-hairpin-helix domain-containing protein [Candidatus Omnitrophota bacterium]